MAFTALAIGGLVASGVGAGVEGNQALQAQQQQHHDSTNAAEAEQRIINQQREADNLKNAQAATVSQAARAMQLRQLGALGGAGAGIFSSATGVAPATTTAGQKNALGL